MVLYRDQRPLQPYLEVFDRDSIYLFHKSIPELYKHQGQKQSDYITQ